MKIAPSVWLVMAINMATSYAHAELPFLLGPEIKSGEQPWATVVADFNNDAVVDLAVANYRGAPNNATILSGNGQGDFTPIFQPTVQKTPNGIATADFNTDGILDLVVSSISNDPSDLISILIGQGNGSFAAPVEYAVGGFPFFVKSADLNADGKPDIVVISGSANSISVFIGIGDGSFQPRVDYPLGLSPMNLRIKDMNSDGIPDVVVAANSFFAAFAILQGAGDGTFSMPGYSGTSGFYFDVAAEDLNRDGYIDVALLARADSKIDVFLANGTGGFGGPISLPSDESISSLAAGDLYGDGHIEIVSSGYSGIRIFDAHDDGTFTDRGVVAGAAGGYESVIADLNADGTLDIISPDSSRFVSRALLNQMLFRSGFE